MSLCVMAIATNAMQERCQDGTNLNHTKANHTTAHNFICNIPKLNPYNDVTVPFNVTPSTTQRKIEKIMLSI